MWNLYGKCGKIEYPKHVTETDITKSVSLKVPPLAAKSMGNESPAPSLANNAHPEHPAPRLGTGG